MKSHLQNFKSVLKQMGDEINALSDKDVHAMATAIGDYFAKVDPTLTKEDCEGIVNWLGSRRENMISVGGALTFFGGLGLNSGFYQQAVHEDPAYFAPFLGSLTFAIQHIFNMATDPHTRKSGQQLNKFLQREARKTGEELSKVLQRVVKGDALPTFTPPQSLVSLYEKGRDLNDYLTKHRQQVIIESIFSGEAMVAGGYLWMAANGDPNAWSVGVPGIIACALHLITAGQNYNRSYLSKKTKIAEEPKALGLPNRHVSEFIAQHVVSNIPEAAQPFLTLGSLGAAEAILYPIFEHAVQTHAGIEATGVATMMLGMGTLLGAMMIPTPKKVLTETQMTQFRESWESLTTACVDSMCAQYNALMASGKTPDSLDVARQVNAIRDLLGKQLNGFSFIPANQKKLLKEETRRKFNMLSSEISAYDRSIV